MNAKFTQSFDNTLCVNFVLLFLCDDTIFNNH